jgi:colanic acid/amylovoran biosynthesis glycosyltransferase
MDTKIVFKTNSFPIISETFIVSNIVETIKNGHEIIIIADKKNKYTDSSQTDLLEKYCLMDKVLQYYSSKGKWKRYKRAIKAIISTPILSFYFAKYILFKRNKSLDYLFILKFYYKLRKAAAFHVHFATAIDPLFELKEIGFLKSKIIITFHGYDAHFLPEGEQLQKLIKNFTKWTSCITVNSEFLKDKLIKEGFIPASIKIIPIGINTSFFNISERALKTGIFKMITVGRFVEIKGQFFGIQLVKLLKDKGYKINYSLVGAGEEWNTLKQLVAELGLDNEIHFYGFRTQAEIKELLKENDLFLMTSTRDKFDRCEAFGVVSLEAQSMGLPVVGFKAGGFPETIIEGETGFTVKDKDVHALGEVVIKLIEDNERLIKIGLAAQRHIKENYNIEVLTNKYLDLYS